jgi:hypothetical protein
MAEFLSREAGYVLEEDVKRVFKNKECKGMGYVSMGWIEDESEVLSGHWCCILLGFKLKMEDEVIHCGLAAVAHSVGMGCQSYSLGPGVEGAAFVDTTTRELVKRLEFAREEEGRLRAGSVLSVTNSVNGERKEWRRLFELWEESDGLELEVAAIDLDRVRVEDEEREASDHEDDWRHGRVEFTQFKRLTPEEKRLKWVGYGPNGLLPAAEQWQVDD